MKDKNARKLLEEVTNLLLEKGCTVNKPAMLDLAIYIIEREKLAIAELATLIKEEA